MSAAITPLQATGFLLASSAVIGNDALQTLGPFLAANRGRIARPWQALFLCAVLLAVLLLGWLRGAGDPAWGRLAHFATGVPLGWPDLIPPLAVLALTQWGAPVSTSFLVLTAFTPANLPQVLGHSLVGYTVAFLLALTLYSGVQAALAAQTARRRVDPAGTEEATVSDPRLWLLLQWLASGWLWSQWLIQDLANLYIYLPRQLDATEMAASLLALCLGVCLLAATNGGAIQQLLISKSNSEDPRATTLISALYGLILFGLSRWSPLPLSTTWVFLGLLGGRELALRQRQGMLTPGDSLRILGPDLLKAGLGLILSVAVALAVPWLKAAR
ncbi:MAG: hypothetical protein WAM11_02190 [Cyanobium sp.]